MNRLEENVQIDPGFVALEFLEGSGDDASRKTRFVPRKRVRLYRFGGRCGLQSRSAALALLTAADHHHMRGYGNVDGRGKAVRAVGFDREPTAGVKQVTGVIAHIGQLEPLHRAVLGRFEGPVVIKVQAARLVLAKGFEQLDAYGRILRDAL